MLEMVEYGWGYPFMIDGWRFAGYILGGALYQAPGQTMSLYVCGSRQIRVPSGGGWLDVI